MDTSNGWVLQPKSENNKLSRRSSSGSLDSVARNGFPVAGLNNGIEENDCYGPHMAMETKGFVNNSEGPKSKSQVESVNNSSGSLKMEAQLKYVNSSDNEGLKLENLFEDGDGVD